MQENGRRGSAGHRGQDALAAGAVLMTVLERFPDRPSIYQLAKEINAEVAFARFDVVERAVRELVGVGLIRCRGASVAPTWQARLLWPARC
jgi:hypothetical protein